MLIDEANELRSECEKTKTKKLYPRNYLKENTKKYWEKRVTKNYSSHKALLNLHNIVFSQDNELRNV